LIAPGWLIWPLPLQEKLVTPAGRLSTTLTLVAARVPFQAMFNVTGQPAAVVPWDLDGRGVPTSVQLVGKPFDEATLLSLAAQIEQARPWAQRRPQVS